MADDIPDPAASALDGILHGHRQHVSADFPAPGVCVSRCADSQPRWPCGAYRAAAATKAALKLADDWDNEAVRLDAVVERSISGGERATRAKAAAQAHKGCADALHAAITREITRKGNDNA